MTQYCSVMSQPNYILLTDVPTEQIRCLAACLDQAPLCELVDSNGNDSISDENWRKLIKRLAKADKKYNNLLEKSYIQSLEKEAWNLKSPSFKLLEDLKARRLDIKLFRSCLEHKDVHCESALSVLSDESKSHVLGCLTVLPYRWCGGEGLET